MVVKYTRTEIDIIVFEIYLASIILLEFFFEFNLIVELSCV